MKQIERTINWDQFKEIESNRELNEAHVKKLVNAIHEKNLLHLNPIIVDAQMRVIDGQHRLEAAKRLKTFIYYVIDETIRNIDISALNSNKKNWALIDYINFYTIEKRPGFGELSKFIANHPAIPLVSALALVNAEGRKNTREVMEGFVRVDNVEQAEKVAAFLKWLRNIYDDAFKGSVIRVVRELFDHPNFDEARFKSKIEDQPRSLVKCVDYKQYKEMMLEIYNYNMSKNRIELR